MLSSALISQFKQRGNVDDLDEGIQFHREAMSLRPEGHVGQSLCYSLAPFLILILYSIIKSIVPNRLASFILCIP